VERPLDFFAAPGGDASFEAFEETVGADAAEGVGVASARSFSI